MNEQLFNGMRGITRRLAYCKVFIALGFSIDDAIAFSQGDYPGIYVGGWNYLIGEVK